MSLSERLARAKTERMLAAGLLHSEAALKPEPALAPDPDTADDPERGEAPVVIEVVAPGLHAVAPVADDERVFLDDTDAEPAPQCPKCRRPGHVDLVDLVGQSVHMSCEVCGTMWRAPHTVSQPG